MPSFWPASAKDACSVRRSNSRPSHRLGFADGARQALGATRAGQGAELDFRLAELRRFGGEDEVAHHRQLAAAAEGDARHRSDHRLAEGFQAFPVAGDEIALV